MVSDERGQRLLRAEDSESEICFCDRGVLYTDAEQGVGVGDAVEDDACWVRGIQEKIEGGDCSVERERGRVVSASGLRGSSGQRRAHSSSEGVVLRFDARTLFRERETGSTAAGAACATKVLENRSKR